MSDLTDLNPLSPTGTDPVSDGDNELRALKNALVGDGTALQGSFTPTFTGQYTGTAAELNAVNTAIQPTDDLDALNDVTYSPDPPTVGDHLVYGAGGWANETPATAPGSARYAGYAGKVTDQPYFTTEVSNTIPAALATVKNDGTGGFGWTVTAAADVLVTLNFTVDFELNIINSSSATIINYTGVGLNTAGSNLDGGVASDLGSLVTLLTAGNYARSYVGITSGCSITLAATDYLTVSFLYTSSSPGSTTSSVTGAALNLSVTDAS